SLQLFSKAIVPFRMIVSLYILVIGSYLVNNIHFPQAFGHGITAVGAFLIICSFWNAGNAVLMHGGMTRHNKFILLVASCLDMALMAVQATLGATLYSHTVSDYQQEMHIYTSDDCLEFTRSDRYAAMMLVWRSYTYLSLDYTKYYQRLVTIQSEGSCCGFGPPLRCQSDSREFPSWASTHEVELSGDRRYTCGEEDNWYEENYFCKQYVDETAVFPVLGGCQYDFPMGDCMDVDVTSTVRGCAAALEAHMVGKIEASSYLIMALGIVTLGAYSAGCCLFWKRSYEDTLPDHVDRHVPWDPFAEEEREAKELKRKAAAGEEGHHPKWDKLGIDILGEMPETKAHKIHPT
ncbi:unnamed protein product, partial [Discosporangium mesarthrocarpum]